MAEEVALSILCHDWAAGGYCNYSKLCVYVCVCDMGMGIGICKGLGRVGFGGGGGCTGAAPESRARVYGAEWSRWTGGGGRR